MLETLHMFSFSIAPNMTFFHSPNYFHQLH